MTTNYYVVQFKELPYNSTEKYIIVPSSWVIISSQSETVYVVYPKEDPKKTRERVKNNEGYGQNCGLYKAIVKFDSSNFKDADGWISNMKYLQQEIERNNDALDNSKHYAAAANNDALSTNGDSTTKADKNILVTSISASTSSVNKSLKEIKLKFPDISITPIIGLDSGTELLEKNNNIAKSIKSADAGSNCLNTSSGNLADKSQRQVSVNNANIFHRGLENAYSQKDWGTSFPVENVRILELELSKRTSKSSKSKSQKVNYGHSHEKPQRLSPPSIKYPQSTVQNVPVLMHQHNQVSQQSSEKIYPDTIGGQQQHQQRQSPSHIPLSQSIATNSPGCRKNHIGNARSTSPVQYYPKIEDQTSRRSPELRTISSNHLPEVPRSQRFLSAESSERIPFNEITKNTPPPVQNLPNQSKKSPNRNLIVRGVFLQDPSTGIIFLRKANNFSIPKPETVQDTIVNSSSDQNHPPSEFKSALGYTDYTMSKKSMEKYFSEKPTITNSPISTQQNSLSRQTSLITDCCFVRKRSSSPTPNQSGQPVPKKQFSGASDNSADQKIFAKELPVEKCNHPNHDKTGDGSQCNPQHVFKTKNNIPNTSKMSNDSKKMAAKIFMNEFDTLIINVRQNVHNYCESIIKEVNSIGGQQANPANSSSPEDTTVIRSNNQHNSNNGNRDDKAGEATKKPRSFILPPDYNPNDTRWTLKYQKPERGIVELIPHSDIYVDAYRLEYCKRSARDCRKLARLLLVEIFALSALSVCSLTSARTKVSHFDGSDIRPELDEHATRILLTFVKEYSIKNRWNVYNKQAIINSVRAKLHEIRNKLKILFHD